MRSAAIEQIRIDGHRGESTDKAHGAGHFCWKYGWPLAFVLGMTLLSEFGPRTVYSKIPPTQRAVIHNVLHGMIK